MKTIMGALIFVLMQFGISGTALAGSAAADGNAPVCSEQTLHGSYIFTAEGFNIVSGVAQPKAIIEGIDFNGDGTLSVPFATVSVNGFIIQIPPGGAGTYTLEANCEGTLTFTNGPHFNIYVRANGREAWMIQTDSNTVFQGTVKRVAR